MYQNAIIADAPSGGSTRAPTAIVSYSAMRAPSPVPTLLNGDLPRWMVEPPRFRRRIPKKVRNFILENKLKAGRPDFGLGQGTATAEEIYGRIASTMQRRLLGATETTGRCPCDGATYNDEQDVLAFADALLREDSLTQQTGRPNIGQVVDPSTHDQIEPLSDPGPEIEQLAQPNDQDLDELVAGQPPATFADELLRDEAFLQDLEDAKSRVDMRLSEWLTVKPSAGESPFGQPVMAKPTYQYTRDNDDAPIVLVGDYDGPQREFLYTEAELAKIRGTSQYADFLRRKRDDYIRAPFLLPYTYRSSHI
ncbi:hypothetical protein GMRT_11468 [Giardia muris]|uniref:Uncharacterized protein n=1 Tax=Giardia muris TaxID=5742 RepID=A0A4Z1SV62_GIAMU|nr:hypothetical protein GMRT_11468 [Giardia muris]|eukprot:TNJ29772.1 hypothetical protein GMRT_11468 [Giardia muris]